MRYMGMSLREVRGSITESYINFQGGWIVDYLDCGDG